MKQWDGRRVEGGALPPALALPGCTFEWRGAPLFDPFTSAG